MNKYDGKIDKMVRSYDWALRLRSLSQSFQDYYRTLEKGEGSLALDVFFSTMAAELGQISLLVDSNEDLGPQMTELIHEEYFVNGRKDLVAR